MLELVGNDGVDVILMAEVGMTEGEVMFDERLAGKLDEGPVARTMEVVAGD